MGSARWSFLVSALAVFGSAEFSFAQTQTRQGAQGALRVIRVTPSSDANPLAQITVTFDRPVAGSLDRAVDPAPLLRVEPAVAGKIEWRDPVTIRLIPATPLTPGTRYTVTVANTFRAMDGSALTQPHQFTFRAHGPTIVTGVPVSESQSRTEHITPTQRFEVVYTAAVDLDALSRGAYIEMTRPCTAPGIVRVRAISQRAIGSNDNYRLREAGGWQRNRLLDSLRRVVQLQPASPLPNGCAGDLVLPREVGPDNGTVVRWGFSTYGPLRVTSFGCGNVSFCPTGPFRVLFTNPVRGSEVVRHLKLSPAVAFTVRDTVSEATFWTLEGKFTPRTAYAVTADSAMRDIFGQRMSGGRTISFATSGYAPSVNYPFGNLLVEREGFGTLSASHVNIDTLIATVAAVPDSLEPELLSRFGWAYDSAWTKLQSGATVRRIPVSAPRDAPTLTSVRVNPNTNQTNAPTLFAVAMDGNTTSRSPGEGAPIALVQVTNLGVHARIGVTEGSVWVTGVNDGLARANANVALHDGKGRVLATARTDARGLARLSGWTPPSDSADDEDYYYRRFEGYVKVSLGNDRAVTAINRWDPDLSPWRFGVWQAYDGRFPVAGAVFTERGIYRPGERVHAKAIVRDGLLGALNAPRAGDSVKWVFRNRDDGMLHEATEPLSTFGTADESVAIPAAAPVGTYQLEVQSKRQGQWMTVGRTSYRVAEYRPPEFLVSMIAAEGTRLPGDRFSATVQARYLFGAPMGRANMTWMARYETVSSWAVSIPGFEGWYRGESGNWWEDERQDIRILGNGADTLDVRGERQLSVVLPESPNGRAARVTLQTEITDINRQVVGSNTSALVHPADFYIAAKPVGTNYFWQAGTAQPINVVAVRPGGEKVVGARIQGTIARREWHTVRRERNGVSQAVGDWVTDTVSRCTIVSANDPVRCDFTPRAGGIYVISFTATDTAGRRVSTSFQRWAAGSDWVPWNDESQFKMDVIPDRARYTVGDTATVLFASPFTNAEAWITVEREGLIEQRRLRLTSGSTTLKFPITEAFAPNAFISILVARGRSAPPSTTDDPGRPTIRVGYAQLRVTPEAKRLALTVTPGQPVYGPADTATVRVTVRDAAGRGQRSEVTLWAVDEGVLSLTGYKTPDLIDLIYQARGLGMRLASNMTSVAPQIPEGDKGRREPGGGGGADAADVLRSRFQTTAFFLGSVITDAAGNATASAQLPDNLTTFRVMAVAVTTGDRYGSGESPMLVTRELLARQALPRFVRPGDRFVAGAVINRRDGAAEAVQVRATATGVTRTGAEVQSVTLAPSRGAEARFQFRATREDSATFRFDVTGRNDTDAVRVSIPGKPDHHPRTHTIAGVVRDTSTVEVLLPANIDPVRSRVSLSFGVSPLASIRGMGYALRVYPYYCTEQLLSTATPLIALYAAERRTGQKLTQNAALELARAVELLRRRQRADGAMGYWSSSDWSTAWLSAYAGNVLLDARELGVAVDSTMLNRLADYVASTLRGATGVDGTPIAHWYWNTGMQLRDRVAAVDFLSRYGRADVPAENGLIRSAAQLTIEDRARLAEVLARRRQFGPARQLMSSLWPLVRIEGRRATLPDSASTPFYFNSNTRPLARILTATLAVEPQHPAIGPLVETLAQQGRAGVSWLVWNTQDYASAIQALAAFDARRTVTTDRTVRVRAGNRVILQAGTSARGTGRDSTVALTGLLANAGNERVLRVSLDAGAGNDPIYYYLNVTEIPTAAPVRPLDRGIQLERWYETYPGGTPVAYATEGDLVRVRIRLTVPTAREFVVIDDPLPAGLEAVDLSLRTASAMPGPGANQLPEEADREQRTTLDSPWGYGRWDGGWWSPFDHREIRDDRVIYSATMLWAGTYTATYLARATTPGTFIKPPAHAEEMYNPAVHGRSDGGTFLVNPRPASARR
jgi:uncharacterized protein YfaS (alpha-2-macroglobulin family)